jgi:predicted Zn-dependent protease
VEALASERRWVEAAGLARLLVDGGARRGRVYVALARGLFRSGAADRCLAILDHLTPSERKENLGRALRVQALLEVGRRPDARIEAERALLEDPSDPMIGRLLARARDPRGPVSEVDPLVTRRRARYLLEAGFTVRAVRVLRELLVAVGPDEGVVNDLALAMAQAQREQHARRARTDLPPVRGGASPAAGRGDPSGGEQR